MCLSEDRVRHYLALAKNACQFSDHRRVKLGSVVVYKNRVISVGWNYENKTSPLQENYNRLRGYEEDVRLTKSSLHAEMSALASIRNKYLDFSKIHLFVYRVKKDGSIGCARPCPACMGYIKELGIRHVYYSTENGKTSWCYERVE